MRTTDGGSSWVASGSGGFDVQFLDTSFGVLTDGTNVRRSFDGGVTWQIATPAISTFFVRMFDASRGVVVGDSAETWETNDGAASFSVLQPHVQLGFDALADVAFGDAMHGWAVGESGTVMATPDTGASWSLQSPQTFDDLNGVAAASATTAWAVGNQGTIRRTTDGGATWSIAASGTASDLESVDFVGPGMGWAVGAGGTILHSSDGGLTWAPQTSGTSSWLKKVFFYDASHGWAVGPNPNPLVSTTDGGVTWQSQTVPLNCITGGGCELADVEFLDPLHGFAVGPVNFGGAIQSRILRTVDGGATWIDAGLYDGECRGLGFFDALNGVVVCRVPIIGGGGVFHVTSDGGVTWETTAFPSSATLGTEALAAWLAGVAVVDADTAFAVGRQSSVIEVRKGSVY